MPKAYKLSLIEEVETGLRAAARKQGMSFEEFVCELILSASSQRSGVQLKPLLGRGVEAEAVATKEAA